MLFRLLGGGQPQLNTPELAQREHDLYVLATMLWNGWEALHRSPERIAHKVWETCPLFKRD